MTGNAGRTPVPRQTREVLVYAIPGCPFCHAAKQLLQSSGIAYTEVDVSARPGFRQELKRITGDRTVPQVVIGGHPVGGYDKLRALDLQGELKRLVFD